MPAIAPITLDVLRHLQIHGTSTRAEIVAGVGKLPVSTLSNLCFLGHAHTETSTKDMRYAITPKGRAKLDGVALRRRGMTEGQRLEQARRSHLYLGHEVREPSNRPGAMDAAALPSRIGQRLYWPDGRVTHIDQPTGVNP
jgi:hypothetical protein